METYARKALKSVSCALGEEKEGTMGRYPFKAKVNKYLAEIDAYRAPATIKKYRTVLREIIHPIIKEAKEKGMMPSTDPKYIDTNFISLLIKRLRKKGLAHNTIVSHLNTLNAFLKYWGNGIMEKLRSRGYMPQMKLGDVYHLTKKQLMQILAAVSKGTSWKREVERMFIAGYVFTGLRNKELRLMDVEDVLLSSTRLYVRHPKGEHSWGAPRYVPIHKNLMPILERYLHIREKYLEEKKEQYSVLQYTGNPLLPVVRKGRVTYYTSIYPLLNRVRARSGVNFTFKDLRASLAQLLKDEGISIETVSRLLGHKTTTTTEKFYARIKGEAIENSLNKIELYPRNLRIGFQKTLL